KTRISTHSTKDSRVVTHHSSNLAIRSLTMGEQTGSRMIFNLWPYASSHFPNAAIDMPPKPTTQTTRIPQQASQRLKRPIHRRQQDQQHH
ncbi:hypothetical protein BJ508DRAFT_214860, partial [Ascobolus immersus RN42]